MKDTLEALISTSMILILVGLMLSLPIVAINELHNADTCCIYSKGAK